MLTHKGTQVLRSERLLLRPYTEQDGEMMFRNWANDEEVCRYLTWAPHGDIEVTHNIVRDWAACNINDRCYHWGITLAGELIGDIAVVRWNEQTQCAAIGYCLGRAWWGQGIMTEALTAVMTYLFDEIGFHRIQLEHDHENPASGRVMRKAGMRLEGCLKDAVKRRDGSFGDKCIYGAIRGQWPARTESEDV